MQFAFVALAVFVSFNVASADRSVIVRYNNGVYVDDDVYYCSELDQNITYAVLAASNRNSTYGNRRNLRTNEMGDKDDMTKYMMQAEKDGHRALGYPLRCKNLCAGVATGYCQAVDCKGYRRRDLSSGSNGDRNLLSGASFTCTQQLNFINSEFDRLARENLVSESCGALLMLPRDISCFDDVIYGVIESAVLRKSMDSTQTVDYTGQPLCINNGLDLVFDLNLCVDLLQVDIYDSRGVLVNTWDTSFSLNLFLLTPGAYKIITTPDHQTDKAVEVNFNMVTGYVGGVKLLDFSTNVTTNFVSGSNVCISRLYTWMFEVDTCVFALAATISGPARFTTREMEQDVTSQLPFTMYGYSRGAMVGRMISMVGNYTLTVIPDGTTEQDKVTIIPFKAMKC